jgi:protein-tyrosine phosphatase
VSATRWIDLEGTVNMRDLGGLPTRDGRAIAPHRLIRSDNLQELSVTDVRRLVDEIGVRDIIDLRSETELHVSGQGPLWAVESLTHHHHSLFGTAGAVVTMADALAIPDHSDRPVRDAAFWTEHYLGYLAGRPDSVSAALEIIATGSGATIVHCAAGKDRTGTVTAIALDVAGVPHEEIVADYALSAERIEAIIERLSRSELYSAVLAAQTVADQAPRPETMETILRTLESEFGGGSGWLRSQGWDDARLEMLRARLTA